MIGLGHVSGPYALAAVIRGAFAGDALSFWIGRRFGPRLRGMWPFSRYPQLLDRGERLFRRHGSKASSGASSARCGCSCWRSPACCGCRCAAICR